jgi:hypothetical protein
VASPLRRTSPTKSSQAITNIYVIYSQALTNDNDISTCHRAHLVIGKHHPGRYLYIFTMPKVLERNQRIPLDFPSGTILALEPTTVSKAPASFEFSLSLENDKDDILLMMWFFTGFIRVNDRASRSLGDGWGEPRKVDITQVDLKGRSLLAVKVSIHHYRIDSAFERYQILFDGITITHFEKRFPGPATQIVYWVGTNGGPPSWVFDVCEINELLPEERLALGPER